MTDRTELLKARSALRIAIHAAEEWHESYESNPETFGALLAQEAALETAVAEYLHHLADRAPDLVDWTELQQLQASSVPKRSDQVWTDEERLLTAVVLQILTDITAIGAVAGEDIYGMPMGFSSLHEAIMQSARKHTATFVRSVTDTTRKLIRESVAQSIELGEDALTARVRLMKVIDNPIRAELIAQTEPVNAYQRGLSEFAHATGAVSKEWDGLAGACKICTPLIGTTIDIDAMFVLANGKEVAHPAGHPRCRCSLIYNYD